MAPVMQLVLPFPDGTSSVVTAEGRLAQTLLAELAGVLRLTPA